VEMKKIILNSFGETNKMILKDEPDRLPKDNEVLVKHVAIGVNYIDIYHRTGLYPLKLPTGLGLEASGVVESVGENVNSFKIGDRVCYCNGPIGAYSSHNLVPENLLLHLPKEIDFDIISGGLLKGLTAYFLLHDVYQVGKNDTILFHAAAGGVGSIAIAWAKSLGAKVIGTVGTDEKLKYAKSLGCDDVINYNLKSFKDEVLSITDNVGVSVVYDSIGKQTITDSMDCLSRRGLLVSFGNASGPADSIDVLDLMKKGSLYVTRPTLFDYVKSREQLEIASSALFKALANKQVSIDVNQVFNLSDVAKAHETIAKRETIGATILKL
tara:strand:+ start:20475 stop:21452 length:978 start_codon:yes stop_codon:yes gene_type:complete